MSRKEVAPGIVIEQVPLATMPDFDFSVMEPGDSFAIEGQNGFTARQIRRSVLQKATRWARKAGKNVRFIAPAEGADRYRCYMLTGAPGPVRRRQSGI